ncbi:hypothetical protein DN38_3236 [Vibrio cholerae]|nr:hypothetical protein DN38_3236 [Vibrio cholerae]
MPDTTIPKPNNRPATSEVARNNSLFITTHLHQMKTNENSDSSNHHKHTSRHDGSLREATNAADPVSTGAAIGQSCPHAHQ